MNFIVELDGIYESEKKKYPNDIVAKEFASYTTIKPLSYSTEHQFIIQKKERIKLYIVEGKQRIYLSDVDIIHVLVEMEAMDIEWFISSMKNLYQGKGEQFSFQINGHIYEGVGLPKRCVNKNINLFSDSLIKVDDFIFLLNFVFAKDKCWEEISRIKGFRNRSLIRYILITEYYCRQSMWAQECLKAVGFPLDKAIQSFSNNKWTNEVLERIDGIELIDICLNK